jgi:C4-dicarboxylate-specific signal transduction histidine kinase
LTIKVDFVIRTNIVYKKKNSWWPKSSMKASGSTMGLGLEITCGIVEDYGGQIHLTRQETQSTTFKVSFAAA